MVEISKRSKIWLKNKRTKKIRKKFPDFKSIEPIENFYDKCLDNIADDLSVIIVEFNPWSFSGESGGLTKYFLTQLSQDIGLEMPSLKKMKKLIIKYSLATSGLSQTSKLMSNFFIANSVYEKNTHQLKEDLRKELSKRKKRVIIVIDDIDRLSPNEILDVFKVVKSVADLPYVIYIMAFDIDKVSAAIETSIQLNGREFIEKIVQLPINMPYPSWEKIFTIFIDDLSELTDKPKIELRKLIHDNQSELDDPIANNIKNLRDVNRYINSIKITYPLIKKEVDLKDFLAIELIRVFHPDIYSFIADNYQKFTQLDFEINTTFESEAAQKEFISLNNKLDDLKADKSKLIKNMLSGMFSNYKVISETPLNGSAKISISSDIEQLWYSEFRICHPKRFPRYFRFSIGESPDKETIDYLMAFDDEGFEKGLVDSILHDNTPGHVRTKSLLRAIKDKNEALSFNERRQFAIISALLNPSISLDYESELLCSSIIVSILSSIKFIDLQYELVEKLLKATHQCKSLIIVVNYVYNFQQISIKNEPNINYGYSSGFSKSIDMMRSSMQEYRSKNEYLRDNKIVLGTIEELVEQYKQVSYLEDTPYVNSKFSQVGRLLDDNRFYMDESQYISIKENLMKFAYGELKYYALCKIKSASDDYSLSKCDDLLNILNIWAKWVGLKTTRDWTTWLINKPDMALDLLNKIYSLMKRTGQSQQLIHETYLKYFDINKYKILFIELEEGKNIIEADKKVISFFKGLN